MKRLLPLLALLAFLPRPASADTTLGTAITSLPYVITKPGVYHFTKDLAYLELNKAAITIETNDVVIDLNGHEILGVSSTTSTAVGIECISENRITIKNGVIRGFEDGMVLESSYASVEGLLVTNCLLTGISINGNHFQVSGNRVCDTGGSAPSVLYAIGISLTGTYGTVCNNDVQNTYETDNTGHFADGIRIRGSDNVQASNNRVFDVEPAAPTKGTATGIALDSTDVSDAVILLGNTVLTTENGFDLSGGATGKYGDNTTSDVTTGYLFISGTATSGMVNIGNNN